MKKLIKSNNSKILKTLLFILSIGFCVFCNAQTLESAKIITPVCPNGKGTIEVSFTGATFPFDLIWYGDNVQWGKTTITSNPQTIAVSGTLFTTGVNGTIANFYFNNYQNYLGSFPLGIHFDSVNSYIPVTCKDGATIEVNNIKGGESPYTLVLYDVLTDAEIVSGNSPLKVGFSKICPANKTIGLKVVDANGCFSLLDTLYVDCKGLDLQASVKDANCNNGSAEITVVKGGVPPYSYNWSNGAKSSLITGLSNGNYYCLVTDSNGCSGQADLGVKQLTNLIVNFTTSPATCINSDGKAQAFVSGGTPPYNYLWQNGSITPSVNNLKPGSHKIVITDSKGCKYENYIYIGSNSPVYVDYSTTTSSCTTPTGTATLTPKGGQAPYTYIWDGTPSNSNKITNLPPGQKVFTVIDSEGCETKGAVIIYPISQITASITSTDMICPNVNGSAKVYAYSTAGSISYLWNNGATTKEIKNLSSGYYSCEITDLNKCKTTVSVFIEKLSKLKLGLQSNPASCIFSSDGSIKANAFDGKEPYKYLWNTGDTTSVISNLGAGNYWVWVTDALGCAYEGNNNFVKLDYDATNSTCYCKVEGTVYEDLNGNCIQDAGEEGISDVLINAGPLGYTSTNPQGYYSFLARAGTYIVEEKLDKGVSLSACQQNNVSVSVNSVGSGCTKTVNFANQLAPTHDMVIDLFNINAARPGGNYYQKLILKNRGNLTESNIQASYTHDGQLQWLNTNKEPFKSNGIKNHFILSPSFSLKRGEYKAFILDHYTPTNIPLGTTLYYRDTVSFKSPLQTYWLKDDESPWNNISDLTTIVVNSYDPNYKSVSPAGKGEDGEVSLNTKEFKYVVHFENNGTAQALKVVIIDTLDTDLSIESFRILGASHPLETQINNGVVTFTFNNINLDYTPVGVYNPAAQGFVSYTIKAKSSVKIGTKLASNADIYFDYNRPITTNKPQNTYTAQSGYEQNLTATTNNIIAYPNPSKGLIKINLPDSYTGNLSLEVYNIQGQIIKNWNYNNETSTIDFSLVSSGLYVIKVKSEHGETGHIKILKQE